MSADSNLASGENANQSRPAGVRSPGEVRDRRRRWTRPFRRTQRAIENTFGLIAASRRVIEESHQSAESRPIRTTRQLRRVSRALCAASKELGRAADGLRVTADKLTQVPEFIQDAAGKMIDESVRWAAAVGELVAVSNELDVIFSWLCDSVTSGAIPVPVEEGSEHPERAPIFRRITAPSLPPELLLLDKYLRPCIPTRRRPACPAFAEADRRIFRGRAPPSFSTCSL